MEYYKHRDAERPIEVCPADTANELVAVDLEAKAKPATNSCQEDRASNPLSAVQCTADLQRSKIPSHRMRSCAAAVCAVLHCGADAAPHHNRCERTFSLPPYKKRPCHGILSWMCHRRNQCSHFSTRKDLTRGRTDHFSDSVDDREFSVGCILSPYVRVKNWVKSVLFCQIQHNFTCSEDLCKVGKEY